MKHLGNAAQGFRKSLWRNHPCTPHDHAPACPCSASRWRGLRGCSRSPPGAQSRAPGIGTMHKEGYMRNTI